MKKESLNAKDNIIFPLIDFLACRDNIKPVSRVAITSFDQEKVDYLKKICRNNNLKFFIGKIENFYNTSESEEIFYISKFSNLLKKAYWAEKEGERIALADFLGYPKCCSRFFFDNLKFVYDSDFSWAYIIFLNSKGIHKESFYLNGLFNSNGKAVQNDKASNDFFKKIYRSKKSFGDFSLSSHIPCSFNCAESIEKSKDIFKILKKELPDFADEISKVLKKPVLVFDDFSFIVFDGRPVASGVVSFDSVNSLSLCPDSFTKEVYKKSLEGNKIKVNSNNIKIMKNDNVIYDINKEKQSNGFLLNFF